MKNDLIQEVWEFALARYQAHSNPMTNVSVNDILLVATLWGKGSYDVQVGGESNFARLFNAFAMHKRIEMDSLGKNPIG